MTFQDDRAESSDEDLNVSAPMLSMGASANRQLVEVITLLPTP